MDTIQRTGRWARLAASIRRYPVLSFYLLTAGYSAVFFLLAYVIFDRNLVMAWMGLFAPSVSALVVTAICEGRPGLQRLLAGLFRWRVRWSAYLFTFGVPPLLLAGAILLHDGPASVWEWAAKLLPLAPFILAMTLLMGLLTAGEEIGWRGFALPRLQTRWGALRASLLIGFLWGLWHIPAALDPSYVLNRFPLLFSGTLFTLACIGLSILYTWLWNHSGGSLLLISLFHSFDNVLFNLSSAIGPYLVDQYWFYLAALLVLLLVLGFTARRELGKTPVISIPGRD